MADCERCGTDLTHAPGGLCPRCLLDDGAQTRPVRSQTGPTQPEIPVDELATLFPDLEIESVLGQGGMGVVYKARQRKLDRWVALKLLPNAAQRDPEFVERFAREARAMARLVHPNILTVHDYGEAGNHCFLIMEFVDGVTLRELIDTGPISAKEALEIIPQICDALQFAHDQGIVHRDIKPENVLMNRRGEVKMADFGLAKLLDPAVGAPFLTHTRHVMGTPSYMAPEQLERPLEVDHRADIYSLGVVLYELLTGELPLGRFAPPSKKVEVDVRLDEVVLRALDKEPEARYQHASDVKTDLVSTREPVARRKQPVPPPPANAARSGVPTVIWVVIALVVLVPTGLGVFVMLFFMASVGESVGGGSAYVVPVPTQPRANVVPSAEDAHASASESPGRDASARSASVRTTPNRTPVERSLSFEATPQSLESHLADGKNIDERDDDGMTGLMRAVVYGDRTMVLNLLAVGADPTVRNADGKTALMLAVESGMTEVVAAFRDIARLGTGTGDPDRYRKRVSSLAGFDPRLQRFARGLRGSDTVPRDNEGRTALMLAARVGDPVLYESVFRLTGYAGALLVDSAGQTAFVHALRSKQSGLAIDRIERHQRILQGSVGGYPRSDVDVRVLATIPHDGKSPLELAAACGPRVESALRSLLEFVLADAARRLETSENPAPLRARRRAAFLALGEPEKAAAELTESEAVPAGARTMILDLTDDALEVDGEEVADLDALREHLRSTLREETRPLAVQLRFEKSAPSARLTEILECCRELGVHDIQLRSRQ